MQAIPGFVNPDRRFRQLDCKERPEESALSSYTDSLLSPGLTWDDLNSKHRLVVVLGEPGSGKTWEFRELPRVVAAESWGSVLRSA